MKSSKGVKNESKSLKKRYLIFGALALLVILVLGFIGWIWWNKNDENIDPEDCLSYFEVSLNDRLELANNEKDSNSKIDDIRAINLTGVELHFEDLVKVLDGKFYLNYKYFKGFSGSPGALDFSVNPNLITTENFDALVEDLMKINAIATYDHLGADVCLVAKSETISGYKLRYKIKHYYCTNNCYNETYDLDVELLDDGEILLTGDR